MRVRKLADGIVMTLGDSREVLQGLAGIDALITDPVWPNCPKDLLAGSDDPIGLWRDVWAVMPEVRRASVIMRYDSDPRFLAPVTLPFVTAQILRYAVPGYTGRTMGGHEIAYGFGEPIPSRPGQRVIAGQSAPAQPSQRPPNGHPCSRALVHMDFVVRWWSEAGELVLDPFAGSGTTGVSCVRLERRFVGIEINEHYFDLACRRIDEALNSPRLELEPASVPEQTVIDLASLRKAA
jgi:hypothetical protein